MCVCVCVCVCVRACVQLGSKLLLRRAGCNVCVCGLHISVEGDPDEEGGTRT